MDCIVVILFIMKIDIDDYVPLNYSIHYDVDSLPHGERATRNGSLRTGTEGSLSTGTEGSLIQLSQGQTKFAPDFGSLAKQLQTPLGSVTASYRTFCSNPCTTVLQTSTSRSYSSAERELTCGRRRSEEYDAVYTTKMSRRASETLSTSYHKPDARTRNKYYDVCNNCGKQGHTFKQCKNPITSFGVIIFRIHQNQRQYLMIRRKDTLGYIDFMRGKYSMSNQNYILNMFKQMTVHEKHKLMTYTFEELWKDLWDGEDLPITSNRETHDSEAYMRSEASPMDAGDPTLSGRTASNYRQEESNSREKFNYLSSKIMGGNAPNPHHMYILPSGQTILQYLLMVSNIPDIWKCEADPIPHEGGGWSEPEWGFPKGRRNFQEKDYECALREMTEETGYPSHLVKNIKNILPFDEIFMGSNYKSYKHRYYLMYMNDEDSLMMDNFEKSEVSRMEWKSYEECMATIRPYNLEKKRLITQIEHTLSRYRLFL